MLGFHYILILFIPKQEQRTQYGDSTGKRIQFTDSVTVKRKHECEGFILQKNLIICPTLNIQ